MKPIHLYMPAVLIFWVLVLAVNQQWLDGPTRLMIAFATLAYLLGVTLALGACGRFNGRFGAKLTAKAPTTE
jgi:hypothetical protein